MTVKKVKIALVGYGNIGSALGMLLSLKRLGEIVAIDLNENITKGKCLDLLQLCANEHIDSIVQPSSSLEDLKDATIVIVTAGHARQPNMQREDLLKLNAPIIKEIAINIEKYCKSAFVICVTNPVDSMTYLLHKVSGLPKNQIVGMAGILDTSRFSYFLSNQLNVSVSCIQGLILGCHGDEMVAFPRFTSVAGISLPDWVKMGAITNEQIDDIIHKTKYGGSQIVNYLKSGSASNAPASSIVTMVESYVFNKNLILPCSALLTGEYGLNDLYMGVPVIINSNGIERIIQLPLNEEERSQFNRSAESVKNTILLLEPYLK